MSKELENFFKNRELAYIVDALARRYGKTPYEVMTQMSINEFCFNVAMMAVAGIEENKNKDIHKPKKDLDWKKFGIKRTVVRKR